MLRRPVLHLVVVGTLALGIGAATAVFSLVYGTLLAPLPFPASGRLVAIHDVTPDGEPFSTAVATWRDLQDVAAFDAVGAMSEITEGLVLDTGGGPVRVQAAAMSASLLRMLTARTAVGRTFATDVDAPGATAREAVISHRLWQERYAARPDTVGRTVRLNDESFTIVGVLPAGGAFPDVADVWVPLSATPASVALPDRDDRWLSVIARLRVGTSPTEARAQLEALAIRLAQAYPTAHQGWHFDLRPLRATLVSAPQRVALWTLAGAVTCLLLLACVNVAGLLLIEAIRRDGEFRLRAVLGASAVRVAAQLLAETTTLALAGALLGVALAYWLVDLVRTYGTAVMPAVARVEVDGPALAAALGLAVASSVAIGLAPGLRAATLDLRAGLGGAGQALRTGRARVRRALVIVEVGLAVVLLAGAALMAASFARLTATDSGFDVTNVLAVPLDLTGVGEDAPTDVLLREIETRLTATPAIEAVGATTTYPWRQFGFSNTVTPREQAATAPPSGLLQAQWRAVSPGFFRAAGIPLLRGALFADDIAADDPRVIVITRTLADRLWPGADPIGREVFWGGTTGTPRTVIGVVGDIRDVRLDVPPAPLLFVPHAQTPVPALTLLVRSRQPEPDVAAAVRDTWRAVVPQLPVPEVTPLADSRSGVATRPRLVAAALGGMALLGVVLATGGIYALLAFSVALRRREIAVRLAVGATPGTVTRLVVHDGLRLATTGIVLGLATSLVLGDVVRGAFYGVSAHDPAILTGVALLLLMGTLAASYVPARAASRTDPAEVLRSE